MENNFQKNGKKTMKSNENLWEKKTMKKINDKTLKKQWKVMKISEKSKNEQPLKKIWKKWKKQ